MKFQLKDARPIWQQLADAMTESIVKGEYPPGTRFPSVRDLAMQAGVNPNTMQRALSRMEDDGLLVTERTSGRTVTEDEEIIREIKDKLAVERAKEFADDMKKLGYDAETAAQLALKGWEE